MLLIQHGRGNETDREIKENDDKYLLVYRMEKLPTVYEAINFEIYARSRKVNCPNIGSHLACFTSPPPLRYRETALKFFSRQSVAVW